MGAKHITMAIALITLLVNSAFGDETKALSCNSVQNSVFPGIKETRVLSDTELQIYEASLVGNPDAPTLISVLRMCGIGYGRDVEAGLTELRKNARLGDQNALSVLILTYATGELGAPKNVPEAIEWIKLAGRKIHSGLRVNDQTLQLMGVKQFAPDYVSTITGWVRKAAFNDDSHAMGEMALADYDAGRYASAQAWLRIAASAGSERAHDRLIWMYQTGAGVVADTSESLRWGERALSLGTPAVYQRMAELITQFRGGTDSALAWAHTLADAGDVAAMNYLGEMYSGGDGKTDFDWEKSEKWWTIAASKGYGPAREHLRQLASSREWKVKRTKVLEEKRAATQSGGPQAYLNLARITSSREERIASYRRAWELGSESAPLELATLFVYSNNSDSEPSEGLRIMHEAAAQGNRKAMAWLSRNYAEGGIVVQDLPLAFALNFLAYADSPDSADELARYQASLPVTLTSPQLAQGRRLATELREPGRFALVLQTYLAR